MKIRNISPNNVIKVLKVEEQKDSLYISYIDESGEEQLALGKIEIEKNKYRNATLQDWNVFLDMLAETAVPASKLQEMELEFGKELDKQVATITARFATEPQNIPTLIVEMTNLTTNKATLVQEMIEKEVVKIKELSIQRTLFHIGGIQLFEKDGKSYKSIEIPQPSKKTRNIKTVSTKLPYLFISFYKKKDNVPVKYSEVKTIDFKDIKLSAKISELTDFEVFKKIFEINNNVLDKILKDGIEVGEDGKSISSLYRLIQITSKNDSIGICNALKEFREKYKKSDKTQKVSKKDIDVLKKHYNDLLNLIVDNKGLPKDYTLYLNLQSNSIQRKALADKIFDDLNENINVMTSDYKEIKALNNVYFTNVLVTIKIPKVKENSLKPIEPRTVWYVESELGNTVEPPKPSGARCQGYYSKQIEHFLRTLNNSSK